MNAPVGSARPVPGQGHLEGHQDRLSGGQHDRAGLALARGLVTKHALKQVNRLLSNEGIDIDAALRHWLPYVVGPRFSIKVAMDWTDFDADGQSTLMLSRRPGMGGPPAVVAHAAHVHSSEPPQRVWASTDKGPMVLMNAKALPLHGRL